jgi:histidinol-phosphate aminotransferase
MDERGWMNNIRKVEPYIPGEQPKEEGLIKLNTNENPYPPSPRVAERLSKVESGYLRLYPDPDAKMLIQALAQYHGLDENQIFVGVGSDDVLALSFLTFYNSNKPVLFPDVTYSFYDVWADLFRIPYERPLLDEDFYIIKEDYYRDNGGIVIANPNAPTSIGVSEDFIRDILNHNADSIVIVDEAYVDFGGETALDLINEYDNLLVVRTFSKSRCMAGARIGYAMGNPYLIKVLTDVKNSYNSYPMNAISISLGVESVKDDVYFKEMIDKVIRTREQTKRELIRLGFHVLDSQTNFLFISHEKKEASDLFAKLRNRKILVRYFKQDRIDNFLRITIGTDEEMETFIDEIKKSLK